MSKLTTSSKQNTQCATSNKRSAHRATKQKEDKDVYNDSLLEPPVTIRNCKKQDYKFKTPLDNLVASPQKRKNILQRTVPIPPVFIDNGNTERCSSSKTKMPEINQYRVRQFEHIVKENGDAICMPSPKTYPTHINNDEISATSANHKNNITGLASKSYTPTQIQFLQQEYDDRLPKFITLQSDPLNLEATKSRRPLKAAPRCKRVLRVVGPGKELTTRTNEGSSVTTCHVSTSGLNNYSTNGTKKDLKFSKTCITTNLVSKDENVNCYDTAINQGGQEPIEIKTLFKVTSSSQSLLSCLFDNEYFEGDNLYLTLAWSATLKFLDPLGIYTKHGCSKTKVQSQSSISLD